jgi:hypothetical protein
LFEFVGPVPAEGEVGMTVDQSWNDQPATGIPALRIRESPGEIAFRSNPQNLPTFPHESSRWYGMYLVWRPGSTTGG